MTPAPSPRVVELEGATELIAELRDELERLLPPGAAATLEQLIAAMVEQRLAAVATESDARELLTVSEAAAWLSCSPAAVRMRIKRGRLATRHHGRRVYVTRESLQRLGER